MNPEQHPTSNIQRPTSNGSSNPRSLRRSMFDVFPSVQGVQRANFHFGEISPHGRGRIVVRLLRPTARRNLVFILCCWLGFFNGIILEAIAAESARPNILWISSEDHGPHMGCYGDRFATTPNADRLAARSMIYTRAWSCAPVCAPARTTIISGMYASSAGAEHMRSMVPFPA